MFLDGATVRPSLRGGVGASPPLCDERGLAVTSGCPRGAIGSASPRNCGNPLSPPRHACEGRHRTSAGTPAARLRVKRRAFVCLRQPSYLSLAPAALVSRTVRSHRSRWQASHPTSSCPRKRTLHPAHPAPQPRHACEGRHRTSSWYACSEACAQSKSFRLPAAAELLHIATPCRSPLAGDAFVCCIQSEELSTSCGGRITSLLLVHVHAGCVREQRSWPEGRRAECPE
jgi:hypothetical protein